MADKNRHKKQVIDRRRYRIRKKVNGTQVRPRLVVHRSLRNIEAQIIDDGAGHSLVGLSTLSKELKGEFSNRTEQGRMLGKLLAAKAVDKGIHQVVFDRAGSLYHGIIKAVAEGAREGGLQF
jgi:large subunit ribosomal protein L18